MTSAAMYSLQDLVNWHQPALPLVQRWAEEGGLPCELLPPHAACDEVLLHLQVTTRSPLGAIAHGTGGILVDGGWLRMLGSGHARLTRDLVAWNHGRSRNFLLVADDAVGGFFAINGGGLGDDRGGMYYFAPDTLAWEALGMGHTDFVRWAFTERLRAFYAELRWPGYEGEVRRLGGDRCFSFYPFLWTAQGSVQASSRRPVSVAEQYRLTMDLMEGADGR